VAAIGGGARLIRPVIVAICLIMLARYLWQLGLLQTNPAEPIVNIQVQSPGRLSGAVEKD
jgi:hypothetical protein